MPGYQLIEEKYLMPPGQTGTKVKRNSVRIGFLDFLKELQQEEFPYNEYTSLLVVGLEDVLLYARQIGEMEQTAREIRSILQKFAGKFDSYSCGNVQIMFRNELRRGDKLQALHPAVHLPVYLIFGTPVADVDDNNNESYKVSFNISG